jgi:hypothetical protein
MSLSRSTTRYVTAMLWEEWDFIVVMISLQVITWGSNANGCLGRPEELADLEEAFCAVPGKAEGFDSFVGRPCSGRVSPIVDFVLQVSQSCEVVVDS